MHYNQLTDKNGKRGECVGSNSVPDNELHLTSMPGNLPDLEAFHRVTNTIARQEYHCHDFYEIYIHLGGGHYFGLDNNMYLLEPDQLFIIPPFCMHGLSSVGEMRDYNRAYVNIPSATLKRLGCGQIDLDRFFRSYTSHGQNRFQLTREQAEKCITLVDELQENQEAVNEMRRFQNSVTLINLLSIICDILYRSPALTGTVISNSIMQDVLTYINSNYTQSVKIDELSHRFGVSTSYLSHEFTKYTSRSVYDYILYRRVMLAKEMIASDMSLNTIAYQCGFNDYSNFLRMFTKIVGASPSRYRAQLKQLKLTGSKRSRDE